jgi:alkylated DNA repair dioxygenase AlkB
MNLAAIDGEVMYISSFYSNHQATELLNEFASYKQYKQREIILFGKRFKSPRLEAFFAKNKQSYSYSGNQLESNSFTPTIEALCKDIEVFTKTKYNSVLINVYRNEKDSNGWHSDDEKELGMDPVIASLSFGETRRIHFKHKTTKAKFFIDLEHGSLLIMKGPVQHYWKHQIPKSKKVLEKRINLTFRSIIK